MKVELLQTLLATLFRLTALIGDQIEALRAQNLAAIRELDQRIEVALVEKEKAIGAIRRHCDEHGC